MFGLVAVESLASSRRQRHRRLFHRITGEQFGGGRDQVECPRAVFWSGGWIILRKGW